MRVVADANTIVSGVLWKGAPRALLDAAREGRISHYTSAALLEEPAQVLPRAKFTNRHGIRITSVNKSLALVAKQ